LTTNGLPARAYGSQSMFAPLRRVLVRRPNEAFAGAEPTTWHYAAAPDLEGALQEHGALVALLRQAGAQVYAHDEPLPDHADAIYVYDPAIVTDGGSLVLSMGKELRRGEEEPLARRLESLGVPTLARLEGHARAEGGDLLWLDHDTLAVGLGFRTNAEGLRQIREAVQPLGVSVVSVELPYHTGPQACLHLLSLISIVDVDLAVVYPPLLSVPFYHLLLERGFSLVEVPPAEFETMGTNVLALAPRHCLLLEGNPVTCARLEAAGCLVWTYRGREISHKAEGGPTCLTRPILRAT
jgi:dimethylargininase